ncbi:MAG TPA: peptidoglycan-binding protein [Blastocatellia bacterium]|nr:peptidoglycan-binding protein [Blastocatellia bacterium]
MTLRRGDSGAAVSRLQQRLKELGFDPGGVGGNFGPGTERAVIAFQQSKQLGADGVAGPQTLSALDLTADAPSDVPIEVGPSVIPQVTVEVVSRMFPQTPVGNIRTNLPFVLRALEEADLSDKPMVLMALGTIRAETESFEPISEFQSKFNTSPGGKPFDLYDNRADLGNQGRPDGPNFRGRGFIQLTGRSNYKTHGQAIGVDLISQPELANDPTIAARLLASFIKSKERQIREALANNDLKTARRLVNGGSHGLDRFTDAYNIGVGIIR